MGLASYRAALPRTYIIAMFIIKRHPEIGDYAVIYAGATILGGDTKIGHHCIIGGNTWITHSVDPYSRITVQIYEDKVE